MTSTPTHRGETTLARPRAAQPSAGRANVTLAPARIPVRVSVEIAAELVASGLRELLSEYADSIAVVRTEDFAPDSTICLVDPYDDRSEIDLQSLLTRVEAVGPLVFYTSRPMPSGSELATVVTALGGRLRGWLTMNLPPAALVDALERIARGEIVVSEQDAPRAPRVPTGLTARELETITLITCGLRNNEIAELQHLSINSVKSYIRSAYRKMGVGSRSEAVLWGLGHGLTLPPYSSAQPSRLVPHVEDDARGRPAVGLAI